MNINDNKIQIIFILTIILLAAYFVVSAHNTQMLGEDESIYKFLSNEFTKAEPAKYFSYNFGKNLPLIQAIFVPLASSMLFMIFGSSLALGKIVVSIFGILTIFLVYLIGKRYNMWYGIASAFLLLTMSYFSYYSLLFYLEVPIAFFSALVTYAVLNFSDSFKKPNIGIGPLIIGALLFLTYLTKFSGLVISVAVFIYFIALFIVSKNKNYLRNLFIVFLVFVLLISPYIIRNLVLYNYPFFEPINFMFEYNDIRPTWMFEAMATISPVTLSFYSVISALSMVSLLLAIFGISYFLVSKNKDKAEEKSLFFSLLLVFIFLFVFVVSLLSSYTILEYRHFSIIYPQIALLGGFFLWKIKDFKKVLVVFILALAIFGLYTSITTVSSESAQVRYTPSYVEGLNWLKINATQNSSVFTTYMGSVMEYAPGHNVVWTIDEFPDVMHATSDKFIYDTLKKYNVSYVLIWNQLVYQNYIIPHANLIGVFTYNFLDKISNSTSFNLKFSNSEVLIYQLTP